MISTWRVYSKLIPADHGSKLKYGIYRTIDPDAPNEIENRQTTLDLYDTYQQARAVADLMNNKEGE